MAIRDLLLTEFDEEMKKTRTMLERVPADKKDFTPHAKSMPLGRLAPHVAELAQLPHPSGVFGQKPRASIEELVCFQRAPRDLLIIVTKVATICIV